MQKVEPVINAEGFADKDIYQWTDAKLKASRQLQIALTEREPLKQALVDIKLQVTELTNSAALEWSNKTLDPTRRL